MNIGPQRNRALEVKQWYNAVRLQESCFGGIQITDGAVTETGLRKLQRFCQLSERHMRLGR